MSKDTPQVDHKAEALRLLEVSAAARENAEFEQAAQAVAEATIHSNLAIAEGQERVAEETKLLRVALAGDGGQSALQPIIDAFVSAADQIPEIIWRNTGGGK